MIELSKLSFLARRSQALNKAFFKNLKKGDLRRLDVVVHGLHEEFFAKTDCLSCGNCCRTLGPMITDRDIELIAQAMRKKPSEIVELYLRVDEDGDYVYKSMPCPFLAEDNYCFIYEHRPKACREYPHTDRRKFYQLAALTIRNAETCPVVYELLEELRDSF